MILNRDSGDNYLLPDEIPPDCRETRYGRINRLPNGLLGYLWECIPHKGIARDFRLYQWDQTTQTDQELYRYPIPFEATAFSFAPDMNYWLQEQSGDGLFNKLHFVKSGNPPVRLLESSFARAGHPSWLADGRIIFAGTQQVQESETNLFSGLPGIMGGLREPWDIYLTDLQSLVNGDVGKAQIVMSGIQYIEAVKASPDGKDVAFLGTIDDNQGLWVYRLETGELARIWAGFGPYDWSPEGDELVVLVREPDAEFFRGQPALIKIPDTLSEQDGELP
jgi:Tol biopolymer transport system component